MDALEKLHQTLNVAASLLDSAATQIRDVPLTPAKTHIHTIGETLSNIFDIQRAVYRERPDLEPKYDEPPEEVRAANRRLGETLIAAHDLADNGHIPEALALLSAFESSDPSAHHRVLAAAQRERLAARRT